MEVLDDQVRRSIALENMYSVIFGRYGYHIVAEAR